MAEARHRPTPSRKLPPWAWIAPLALVVLGVIGFVLFGRGGASIIPGGQDESIPAFSFQQRKVSAISIASNDKRTPASAKAAATDITTTMHTLYTEAFLDPANWRDGSYDEVWPLFADHAESAAQQDASTLTVGPAGGETYTKIAAPKGRIEVRVLLNDKNQVATAVAMVKFSAVGTRKDGKVTQFRSSGQYFLQRGGDTGWQVYSFDVDRDDTLAKPSPTPSGGASAEAA